MHQAWECMKCGELTWYKPTPVNVTRYKRFETAGQNHVYTVDEVTYLCRGCEAWTHKPEQPPVVGGHAVMWTGMDEEGKPIIRNDWGVPKAMEADDVEC